ncbi:MAG: glycosyltransferase involved in cell wall biosynthesis [Rhodothermales bacterium]|jgi:glycosyltransferase involved in cell wall biosynthesis
MPAATTISVVTPTFNRVDLLVRALESVFAQTHPADEVIVVDDGSTDDTVLRTSQLPITLIQQENRGVSAARNVGIRAARGDWIALLDSDDEWLPEKLEKQLARLASEPGLRVCHTQENWIRLGKPLKQLAKHQKYGGWIFPRCLDICLMSPSSILIHREVFEAVGLFDESLPACEDFELWLRITARYPVAYIETPLIVKHGGHADQLSMAHWGMDRFRIYALEQAIFSDSLKPEEQSAAIAMAVAKIEIYLIGARKREKFAEIADYEARRSVLLALTGPAGA